MEDENDDAIDYVSPLPISSSFYYAAALVETLLRELRKVEWVEDVGDDEPAMRCPTCGELQDAGHAGDCSLALALAAARDAKEGK